MSYWYLASPYTHSKSTVKEHRYKQAVQIVAALTDKGLHVFSPIVHYHRVAIEGNLPGDADFWYETNRIYLHQSSGIIVARLDGWEKSKGIAGELELARTFGLPILDYDLRELNK